MKITVKDVNDNPPRFVDAPYSGAVLENASLGMTVMRVTAVDKDQVMDFLQITYLIIQQICMISMCGQKGIVIRHPYITDILRYTYFTKSRLKTCKALHNHSFLAVKCVLLTIK